MKKYYVLSALLIIIVILSVVFKDNSLDIESQEVKSLYKYLGKEEISHCGGLITYQKNVVTRDNLEKENMFCMAYHNLNAENIKSETIKSNIENENGLKICRMGEDVTLAADETEVCSYELISKNDLLASYKKIYGSASDNLDEFYVTNTNACYLEGDSYYCGEAQKFTYSLANQATIYRVIKKATKKMNNDIIIYDYFLKISDNICYQTNDSEDEGSDCKDALSKLKNNEIDVDFVMTHGSLYKHTFRMANDNNYYWLKSEN